jgi:hypothetical protein
MVGIGLCTNICLVIGFRRIISFPFCSSLFDYLACFLPYPTFFLSKSKEIVSHAPKHLTLTHFTLSLFEVFNDTCFLFSGNFLFFLLAFLVVFAPYFFISFFFGFFCLHTLNYKVFSLIQIYLKLCHLFGFRWLICRKQ